MIKRYNSSDWDGGASSYGSQGICSVCGDGAATYQVVKNRYQRAYCTVCKELYFDIKRVHGKKWTCKGVVIKDLGERVRDDGNEIFMRILHKDAPEEIICVKYGMDWCEMYEATQRTPSWGNPPFFKIGDSLFKEIVFGKSEAIRKVLWFVFNSRC